MQNIKIQKLMMPLGLLLVFFICTAQECLAQPQKDISKEPSVMTYKKPDIIQLRTDKIHSVMDMELLKPKPKPKPPRPPLPNPPCPAGNCLPDFLKMGQTVILTDATTKEVILMGMPDKSKPLGQGTYGIKYLGDNSSYNGNAVMTLTDHNQLTESVRLFDVPKGMLKQLF